MLATVSELFQFQNLIALQSTYQKTSGIFPFGKNDIIAPTSEAPGQTHRAAGQAGVSLCYWWFPPTGTDVCNALFFKMFKITAKLEETDTWITRVSVGSQ